MTTTAAAPPRENRFKQATVRAVGWSWIGQTGRQGLTFAVALGLARLVAPEHFGLIAMVLVFSEFALLLADAGLGAALVQRQEIEPRHFDTVFWLDVGLGVLLAVLLVTAAPWLAAFYGEPALAPLARALAPVFVLGALAVVPQAVLTRGLAFDRIARVEIAATALSGGAALAGAAAGLGIGALVVQQLVLALATAVGLWSACGWRPRRRVERAALRELVGFGGHLLGSNTLNYWTRNADNLLVGRFAGAAALGFYSYAYRIMVLPLNLVTRVLQRVMFSAMARIQDEPERVAAIWLRAAALIGLITVPLVCGLFVLADSAVACLLGERWRPVAPILQVLCFAALKQPMGSTTGWIYQSQGRTDLMLRWGVVNGAITIGAFAAGVHWGALGVAAAYSITRYLTWYHGISIPGRLVGVTFGRFVGNLAGVFGCGLAMALAVWLLGRVLPPRAAWLDLVLRVPFGAAVYLALVWSCDLRAWRDLRGTVAEQVARLRAARA